MRGEACQPLVGEQLVFKGIISSPSLLNRKHVELMGDTGCASLFLDETHARANKYTLIPLTNRTSLELADGTVVTGVSHMARVLVSFDNHHEEVLAYVTKLAGVQMILGNPWFKLHKPTIDWDTMSLTFASDQCLMHCISNHRPCHARSSRHRKKPLPDPPPNSNVHFVSSKVAAAAIAHGNQTVLVTRKDIEALAEYTNDE
jgi:hypothetical protein